MSDPRPDGKIHVGGAPPPTWGPVPAPRPRPQKANRPIGGYQYYLQDYPVLIPVLSLIIGGICLYLSLFSKTLQNLLLGSNPLRRQLVDYNTVMAWIIAFTIGGMFISFIFLSIHGTTQAARRLRRRPAVCPRCQAAEAGAPTPFKHAPVEGTEWEEITCPQCSHSWFGRL
jgi:hypothetical protein